MNRKAKQSLSLVFLCLCLVTAAASCMSKEAKQALTDAKEDNASRALIFSSGSSAGKRAALPLVFPGVADLIARDGNARLAMLARFSNATSDDDMELCMYAYALEQLGDTSVVPALRRFISRSFGDGFMYAPHFAAHAILSLTGELAPANDINWYPSEDLDSIAAGGGLAASVSGMQAARLEPSAAANPKNLKSDTCIKKYVLADENNQPLKLDNGDPAIVHGLVYACPKLKVYDDTENAAEIQFWNDKIAAGGGARVSFKGGDVVDGKYGNTPTRQFNCGGYASRKMNDDNTWNVDPECLRKAVTQAKVVERIDNETWFGSRAKNDLIFYFTKEGDDASHVAVVYEPGVTYDTVWNADEVSGLFESSATAQYFTNGWFFGVVYTGRKFDVRKTYRWKPGQPRVIPYTDPSWLQDPKNCDVMPVTDGKCPEITEPKNPFAPENACPIGAPMCDYCTGVASGTTWIGELMIGWQSETSLHQLHFTGNNFGKSEAIDYTVTFIGDATVTPYNATLTVTHNKVTGAGGSGYYTFSDSTQSKITSADISLDFSGKYVSGTLVVHTENGKTATVEVKGDYCTN